MRSSRSTALRRRAAFDAVQHLLLASQAARRASHGLLHTFAREPAEVVVSAQAPSDDTMQVPMGVSGVQAVPNTLHSHGLSTPFSTSPHWQALGSATRTPGTSKMQLGIEAAYCRAA